MFYAIPAPVASLTETERSALLDAWEDAFFARYGTPPAEEQPSDAPTWEDARDWSILTRDEPTADELNAIEAAAEEHDWYADTLQGRFEEQEIAEFGSQVGHADW